jgi:hypothetical protein
VPNTGANEDESEQLSGSANRENGASASEACVRANGEGDRGLELHYAARWCDNLSGIDVEAHPTRTELLTCTYIHICVCVCVCVCMVFARARLFADSRRQPA